MAPMTRRRTLRLAAGGAPALALLAAGCSGGTAPPADSFYRLQAQDPGRRYGTPLLPGTLEVGRFDADGVTGERALVYSEGAGRLRRYSYHYWVDSPTRLIQKALVESLRTVNAAQTVVTPNLRLLADWRLEGSVDRLEHRLIGEERAEALLAVEFSVVNARDGRLVMIDSFSARRDLASQDVSAAADAFDSALTEVVAQFLDKLETAAKDVEAPPERRQRRS